MQINPTEWKRQTTAAVVKAARHVASRSREGDCAKCATLPVLPQMVQCQIPAVLMFRPLHNKLAKHGGDVKIAAPKSMVLSALTVMRMGKVFDIYPDVNQARLAFRPRDAK